MIAKGSKFALACPTARFDPSGQARANDSYADEADAQPNIK